MPSNVELQDTLLALIGEPTQASNPISKDPEFQPKPRYLLVDALDELPSGPGRDHVITYLRELAGMNIPNLHILATSRDESDIRAGLHTWHENFVIDKNKVAEDMRLYVTSEIHKHEELSRQNDSIKDLILRRLVEEGNGMYEPRVKLSNKRLTFAGSGGQHCSLKS